VGFLDGMFDSTLDNLFVTGGNDKALTRLHEHGELVPATIYASASSASATARTNGPTAAMAAAA